MERYLGDLDIPVYIHDFDVPIVMPEHLSEVAAWVKDYAAGTPSFPLMVSVIQHVAEKFGENLVSIDTQVPFKLSVKNLSYLTIEQHDSAEVVEIEDLRSMWVSLLNGPLTRTAASKLVNGSAGPLLSVLSVLPQLRPIQVELMEAGTPEPAVEFRPIDRRAAVASG
jgi:hypothetical protein